MSKKTLLLSGVAIVFLAAGIGGGLYFFTKIGTKEAGAKTEKTAKVEAQKINETQQKQEEQEEKQKEEAPKAKDGNSIIGVPDIRDYPIAVKFKPGKEKEGMQLIHELHQYYNQLTGWGAAEHINWSGLDYAEMQEKIQSLRDTLEPNTSRIENDVENASVLLAVAFRYDDSMAMRYVHRIFHDLDHHLNGTKVDREWNVTSAFQGKPEEIRNYLIGHKGEKQNENEEDTLESVEE